jgi:hypothetical protein
LQLFFEDRTVKVRNWMWGVGREGRHIEGFVLAMESHPDQQGQPGRKLERPEEKNPGMWLIAGNL